MCGKYVYHIAIIDYLTEFNLLKVIESFYKTSILANQKEHVSCVHPVLYGNRFRTFMKREVIVNEEKKK